MVYRWIREEGIMMRGSRRTYQLALVVTLLILCDLGNGNVLSVIGDGGSGLNED
jgi:hypothetical protein